MKLKLDSWKKRGLFLGSINVLIMAIVWLITYFDVEFLSAVFSLFMLIPVMTNGVATGIGLLLFDSTAPAILYITTALLLTILIPLGAGIFIDKQRKKLTDEIKKKKRTIWLITIYIVISAVGTLLSIFFILVPLVLEKMSQMNIFM